jgi:hypothetical protein
LENLQREQPNQRKNYNAENFGQVVQIEGKENLVFFNILTLMGKMKNIGCKEALKV